MSLSARAARLLTNSKLSAPLRELQLAQKAHAEQHLFTLHVGIDVRAHIVELDMIAVEMLTRLITVSVVDS